MKKHHLIGIIVGAAVGYWAASTYGNAPGGIGQFFTLPDQVTSGAVGNAVGIPVEGAISGAVLGAVVAHFLKH